LLQEMDEKATIDKQIKVTKVKIFFMIKKFKND
jgi:hypothetical protein